MLKKIPNILTIGRIIIVPFFVLAFYLPGFYGDLTACVLFVIASFTDFLDGMLARMMGEESKLGELLDPIADKLLIASVIIVLIETRVITHIHVIPAIIILLREIAISGLREFLANYNEKVPVTFIAKIKTTIQMVSLSILILSVGFDFNNTIWDAGLVMLWISAIFTLYSGYSYIKKGLTII